MPRIISLAVALMAALLLPEQAAPQNATSVAAHAVFQGRRGIGGIKTFGFPVKRPNRDEYADAPFSPDWRVEMTQGRLAEISSAGFDFIRININPAPLFAATDDALARHLDHIRFAVSTSLEAGLDVVLDIMFQKI